MEFLWVILAIGCVVILTIVFLGLWFAAVVGGFGETAQAISGFAAIGMIILVAIAVPLGAAAFLFAAAAKLLFGH